MRCGLAFGSGRLLPATVATVAPEGTLNSQVDTGKTDGFVLTVVAVIAGSLVLGRIGIVPGPTRRFIGDVVPSTVIDGQTLYGVMRRAIAWLLAPISTHAESPSAESGGQATSSVNVSPQAGVAVGRRHRERDVARAPCR